MFAEGDVYSLPLPLQGLMCECAELIDELHGEEGEGGVSGEEATRRLVDLYARVRNMN